MKRVFFPVKIMFCARIKRVWDSSFSLGNRSVSTGNSKIAPVGYALKDLGIARVSAWWVFHARFVGLTTMLQKIRVFWDVTPYWLVNILWGRGDVFYLKTLSVAKIVQRRWLIDGLIGVGGGRRAVLVHEVTIYVICACVCVSGLSLSENRTKIK